MMDKEFVPHELALELKQIGFDEPCLGYYIASTLFISNDTVYNSTDISVIKAPLFQQSFRWFREKHGMSIYVSPLEDGSAFYYMVYTNINVPYSNRICSLPSKWNTYEEAELACLKKLIELVKN